jgi:hypothetical protein
MKDSLPLVRALVDALLLLETSGPDELDPDTAVRGMENVASSLLTLDVADQRALRDLFLRLADTAPDETYSKFVRGLPTMLGLPSD